MADTEVMWSGLTLGGDTGYILEEITGWEDLPDVTSYDTARSRGHGDHVGDQYARSRIVTVSGKIANVSSRDEMARALQNATRVGSAVNNLTVDLLGLALTAGARVTQRSVSIGGNYSVGEIPFAVQWRCPDPLRYGLTQTPASIGLPSTSGGLPYPLSYPLNYGSAGTPGQITLTNSGTADTSILFTVTGPLPSGFEISAGGQRLTYAAEVPAGQVITLDTGTGIVLAEGTADRRGNLTKADWLQVPAGSSITVQFTSLGGTYDAAATLSASWRSAWW